MNDKNGHVNDQRKPYLLLLHNPSPEAARQAWTLCRQLNIPVPAQYGSMAIEVFATPDEVEGLYQHGLFAARTARSFSRESIAEMSPRAREIAEFWNQQFSADYLRRKSDKSKRGLPYNSPGKAEPAPYVDIDVPSFRKRLEEQMKRRNVEVARIEPVFKLDDAAMTPDVYLRVKKYIGEQITNEKVAYQLASSSTTRARRCGISSFLRTR